MRVLVCYPIKTLVSSFIPAYYDVLTVEKETELASIAAQYQPQVAVFFTDAFTRQVWEWVPEVFSIFLPEVPKVFVATHHDHAFVKKIVEDKAGQRAYVLPAGLTYAEIKEQLAIILEDRLLTVTHQQTNGKVIALLSYGSAGVTTFSINYPVLLARRLPSAKIAVIDMNVEKPDLTKFFQLKELALFRPDLIESNFAEKRNWMSLFTQSKIAKNLYYAGGACKWRAYEISSLLNVLRSRFDYIYVDWGFCFPETEGLHRLLGEADQNLFFVRADPFNFEHANQWLQKWEIKGVKQHILISQLDREESSSYHIRENGQVYGVLPHVPDARVSHSHRQRSILVEEFLPPKKYKSSLLQLVEAEQRSVMRELRYADIQG
ncbi:UNVERIFIED_CONTAM: hypothetical protein ABID98_003940 [Brevibacillus sp. OAP136]